MDNKFIDLHVHSTYSDGTLTPAELVEKALEIGMSAMAITDHDTCDGVLEAESAAKGTNLIIIPGIELSTEYDGLEVHVLGLFIDPQNPTLLSETEKFRYKRDHRNEKIVEKLREHGFEITMDALLAENKDAVITRANIARFLVDHGQIGSVNHAFEKYIGDDGPCYVGREKITPMEACKLITSSGGIPILAHPVLYHFKQQELCTLIEKLMPYGLKGIEALYATYDKGQEKEMKALAEKYQLLISGGSDFHGDNKPYIHLGLLKNHERISFAYYEKLLKEARS